MSEIAGQRKMIQIEEVAYAAAVSSGTGSRLGSSINFINLNQYDHKGWVLNGKYGTSTAAQNDVDGALPVFRDSEIVGIFMYNFIAGSSGTTQIDIKRHTASGSGTTIFSIKPSISFTAGNNAYLSYWLDPSEILENPTGTVIPTFSVTSLDKGDALTLDFVSKQLGGNGLTVALALRPR